MVRLMTVGVLAIVAWPVLAEAQEASASLESLIRARDLRRGVGIYLTDEAGQRIKGKISALSGNALTVETRNGERSFSASAIRRVELQDPIDSGIWLGAGLALAGTYVSCYAESRAANQFCYGTAYAFLPALGVSALIGGIVDARTHKTVYEAPGTRQVTLTPGLSPTGVGLRASIKW